MAEWYILALYAAVFATFSTIIHKKLLFKEHALEFVTTLALINAVFSIFFLIKADFSFSPSIWPLLIVVAILNSVGAIYLSRAFRHLEISAASPLMGFEPAILVIMAFLFLQETITFKQTWGLVLTIFGGYLLEIKKENFGIFQPIKEWVKSKYIRYAFLAIFLYSISSTMTRYLVNSDRGFNLNPYTYAFLIHFLVASILLLVLNFKYDGLVGIKNGVKNMGWMIIPAALFSLAHGFLTLFAISIPAANVGLVIVIKRTSIFFETLIGGELFHDSNLFFKGVASIIIIAGIYLIIV